MNMPLAICLTGTVLYTIILAVYGVKISKAKKYVEQHSAPGTIVPRSSKSFKTIFVMAFLLILLPFLIPLQTYVIAIVVATGVLGAYIALKDRLEEVNALKDSSKN